jgi:hypothetical protein
MDIIRLFVTAFFGFLSFNSVIGQKATLLNSTIDGFPKVELEFNYRSPILLDTTSVKLVENGKPVLDFTLKKSSTETLFKSKQILIIIENSYWERFDKQLNAVKLLWSEIAGETIGKEDQFFVATFDWSKGNNTLQILNKQGTSSPLDVNDLIQAIVQPTKDGRIHQSTEIYPALIEGVAFLKSLNKQDSVAQAILLFSSEFNNIYNNTQTKTDVVISARNSGIPIYTFRYPYSTKYNLRDIAVNTYGHQLDMSETDNQQVVEWINQIPRRYAGENYILKFESSIAANNDFRDVNLVLSDEESLVLRYQSPSKWNIVWKNKAYRYGIIVFVLLIFGFVIFIGLFLKNRRTKQVESLERIKEETQRAIHQSELKRERENILEEEKVLKKREEEFNYTLQNHFNRLQRSAKLEGAEMVSTEVLKPVFYIGRRPENDILLTSSTVSKVHAVLYYDHIPEILQILNERKFIIIDFDSTNGTFVNGKRIPSISEIKTGVKPYYLNDTDLIQIGDVSITFMD